MNPPLLVRLKALLEHPLTRGLPLDAPETTLLRRRIVAEKPFLRRLYVDWYRAVAAALPGGDGPVVELGAGGGFMHEHVPGLLRSDVVSPPGLGLDLAVDAQRLPFAPGSLRALAAINVLHHVREPRRFLAEVATCLAPGGRLVLWEPWVTWWSVVVYRWLHHEPCEPDAPSWELPPGGPLSTANAALPWIVFARDRASFEVEFPALVVRRVELAMPFRYVLSGGVSLRSLAPGWSYPAVAAVEALLAPLAARLAMFAFIVVERR